ncbi:MAG: B12-binding domain-containing radical SAM protein [Thermoplasmata archaeon]
MAEGSPGTAPSEGAPRVLLVDPYMSREDPMERKFVELYPSLSLLTLAAYLRQQGIPVRIVDLTFERSVDPVRRAIRSFRPRLLGVHTKSLTLERALQVAALARQEGIVPIAGGPDSASRPETYLTGGFEAVVLAEGEEALVELATCSAGGAVPDGIAGVMTRRDGQLQRGPARPFLADLDRLPLPAWDLIDMEAYLSRWQGATGERRAALLTSRGCPFDCSWCSKPTFGRSFRQQTPARVLAELAALRDTYKVDYVRFCDDVFGIRRPWLEELLEGMEAFDPPLAFECLARVDLLKPDLLGRMKKAGLARVYVGVESGSQKMLDLMNRGTRLAQVERVATELKLHGIRQFWFLMLGYPGETLEDIEATLALFRRFSPEEYSVSIAVPLPGTRFYDLVKDRLRGRVKPTGLQGSPGLLYEAAYPEELYRWTQARFAWEAGVGRLSGRFSPQLLSRLRWAADLLTHGVAEPLLMGGEPGFARGKVRPRRAIAPPLRIGSPPREPFFRRPE